MKTAIIIFVALKLLENNNLLEKARDEFRPSSEFKVLEPFSANQIQRRLKRLESNRRHLRE